MMAQRHCGPRSTFNSLICVPHEREFMALSSVLLDELRDMYSAENQLVKALPKLAKGAKNPRKSD
jgi:hypothetical protein